MRPGFWPYLILRLRRVGKLFLPLLLVAALFVLLGFSVLTQKTWLLWAEGALTAGSLIYAIVSSIKIEKDKKRS